MKTYTSPRITFVTASQSLSLCNDSGLSTSSYQGKTTSSGFSADFGKSRSASHYDDYDDYDDSDADGLW